MTVTAVKPLWPQVVTTGSITIEAHAPWCPQEQARIAFSGSDAHASVIFQGDVKPPCHCQPVGRRDDAS